MGARDELYVLDRCSGALYTPEVSLRRYRRAVAYHAPAAGLNVVRRPAEYYRCLANLGAKLISNAQYAEACETFDVLDELVDSHPQGIFPRLDFPRMNHLLALYRSKAISAQEAADRQGELVARVAPVDDSYYAGNAHACFMALAGRPADAATLLRDLQVRLHATNDTSVTSIAYLLGANLCSARYAAGDGDVLRDWARLQGVLDSLPYVIKPMLSRRHGLLAELFSSHPTPGDAESLDVALLERSEFGPVWNNFGRAFRMPEVEFWQDL